MDETNTKTEIETETEIPQIKIPSIKIPPIKILPITIPSIKIPPIKITSITIPQISIDIMDDLNKKAATILITKGPDAAIKHMFTDQTTGKPLTYGEMRSRYG